MSYEISTLPIALILFSQSEADRILQRWKNEGNHRSLCKHARANSKFENGKFLDKIDCPKSHVGKQYLPRQRRFLDSRLATGLYLFSSLRGIFATEANCGF